MRILNADRLIDEIDELIALCMMGMRSTDDEKSARFTSLCGQMQGLAMIRKTVEENCVELGGETFQSSHGGKGVAPFVREMME